MSHNSLISPHRFGGGGFRLFPTTSPPSAPDLMSPPATSLAAVTIETPDSQPLNSGALGHHTVPVHVRVRSNISGSDARYVGVLTDWRKEGRGWEGYVIWAEGGGTTSVSVRQAWVGAGFLEKV